MAACIGGVDACRALISAKADAAVRDECDAIPLAARAHDALRHSRASCSFGYTPLKRAIEHGERDVIVFLRSVGAPE